MTKSQSKINVHYLAWLSSKGEREEIRNGALYAGLVDFVPDEWKSLLDPNERRRYVIISSHFS